MRWAEIIRENTYYFGGLKIQPSRAQVQRYMRGWCPYLALAFHDVFGYQIVGFGEHICAQISEDEFIDIRGRMNSSQMTQGLSGHLVPYTRDDLLMDMNRGEFSCGFFDDKELNRAKNLVRKIHAPE